MNALRIHARAIAVVMVSVVTATVTIGALRACWGAEHRHAGIADPECAMHHGTPAPVDGHGHHVHGLVDSSPQDQRMTCNCANDTAAPLVVPHAILVERGPHLSLAVGSLLGPRASLRVPDTDRTPLSPPPRPTFS